MGSILRSQIRRIDGPSKDARDEMNHIVGRSVVVASQSAVGSAKQSPMQANTIVWVEGPLSENDPE